MSKKKKKRNKKRNSVPVKHGMPKTYNKDLRGKGPSIEGFSVSVMTKTKAPRRQAK